jgi:GNAT superfamily N-acetyltransferase
VRNSTLRHATRADIPSIERVMRRSMESLGLTTYDEQQVSSAVRYITQPDTQLIDDGTYYVVVADEQIVACGGWSGRAKLYSGSSDQETADKSRPLDPATEPARIRAMFVHPDYARRGIGKAILEASEDAARESGFKRLELMALLPGVPLYEGAGYTTREASYVELPDGVRLETVLMEKSIEESPA